MAKDEMAKDNFFRARMAKCFLRDIREPTGYGDIFFTVGQNGEILSFSQRHINVLTKKNT
jgi:hypothetical protein